MNCATVIKRTFFLTLLATAALQSEAPSTFDRLQTKKTELQNTISKSFEKKQDKFLTQLQTEADEVKKEPLYKEVADQLQLLEQTPEYQQYTLLTSSINLIAELQQFNTGITQSDLLTKTHDGVALLEKQVGNFSLLRTLLKKQRVALIELLDEKDLIESNEKNLRVLQKELAAQLTEQKTKLTETEQYRQLQEVQKNYLERPALKKIDLIFQKLHALQAQRDIALLRNPEYLDLVRQIERLDPNSRAHISTVGTTPQTNKLERELFLTPITDLL